MNNDGLSPPPNGRADALVTFNRRAYGTAPRWFGIEVLQPADVLRRTLS